MSDADLLDALDRRAARAVADLDALVDRTVAPPLDLERGAPALVRASTSRWREPRLLAVAAAILAVAVVAAVLVLQQREEPTPVAVTPGEPRRLVLPPDAAAEFDGVSAIEASPSDPPLEIRMHAPVGSEEPWPVVVVEHVIDADDTTLDGEPVDIGVATATYEDGPMPNVGWEVGGEVRYLASSELSRDELVALARATVEEATPVGDPLPGHQVVHRGAPADFYLSLSPASAAGDVGVVVYDADRGRRQFVVSTSLASPERWRAAYAFATSSERIRVRGVDAVLATYEGFSELSWIEGGDTLVRAVDWTESATGSNGRTALFALVEQLVEAGDEEWQVLVGRTSASMDGESSEQFDGQGQPVTPTTILDPSAPPEGATRLITTGFEYPEVTASAWLDGMADGSRQLGYEVRTAGSGTAGAVVGADLTGPQAFRERFDEGTLVLGLIGPVGEDLVIRELRDATGRSVPWETSSASPVGGGTSLWLFVLYTAADVGDAPLSVEGTTTSGAEVVVSVA